MSNEVTVFDLDRLINAFVECIRGNFKDDVALVLGYGSRFRGDHHPKSDLDLVFINDTPRGEEASAQFVIDDIGSDFFPISWERAEGIVSFREALLSLILESAVLYSRSDADLERLESLREKARWMMSPEGRPRMLRTASEHFEKCCVSLYNMRIAAERDDLASLKIEAANLIHGLLFVIFMINQTYARKSPVKEVIALPIKPEGLDELIGLLMNELDPQGVLAAGERLADGTRNLLVEEIRKIARPKEYPDVYTGLYEEFTGYVQKVFRACDISDPHEAFFKCQLLQSEIARFLDDIESSTGWNRLLLHSDIRQAYQNANLPDLMDAATRSDFHAIREAVGWLDGNLKQLFESRGVPLNVFRSIEEFESFLRNR
ncbi:MAG TPA: nucleotidyltransferase domain-containing protein [bacterium]|nr:nucleotidyltransferase domain-containing protein [bacterium]